MKRILVNNGFRDLNFDDRALLACKIIHGSIKVGDILYYKGIKVAEIKKIEKIRIKSNADNIILSILPFSTTYKLHELSGQEVDIHSQKSSHIQ